MAVRLTKDWLPITRVYPHQARPEGAAGEAFPGHVFPGHMGVFEIADASRRVLFIGRADARSLFGLKGALEAAFESVPSARFFRYEVTTAYHTRHLELLMAHVADFGGVPPVNLERGVPTLGTLHPG